MAFFTVNIKNQVIRGSVSVSPIDARGYGCAIPPKGSMNFHFRSEENSNSISLALMMLEGDQVESPTVTEIQTNGASASVRKEEHSKPCVLEIINSMDNSVTNVTVDDHYI